MFPSWLLLSSVLPATTRLLLCLGRRRAAQGHQRCRESVSVAGTSLGIFICQNMFIFEYSSKIRKLGT